MFLLAKGCWNMDIKVFFNVSTKILALKTFIFVFHTEPVVFLNHTFPKQNNFL